MNTTDNRALVAAQLIRAALHEIDESTDTGTVKIVTNPTCYHGALESLAALAEELEGSVASSAQGVSPTPDPQFVSDMLEVFLAASDGEVGAGPTFAAFCAKHGDGRDIEAACRDALRSHIAELRATPAASSSSVTATPPYQSDTGAPHTVGLAPASSVTPTPDKRKLGLYGKFTVTRTDGTDAPGLKHDGCEYFVLDLSHDPFTVAALRAYADECAAEYPALARDLRLKTAELTLGAISPEYFGEQKR